MVSNIGPDLSGYHSRPIYHALNAAIWTGIPALVFLLLWLMLRNAVTDMLVLNAMPGTSGLSAAERQVLINEVRQVALGNEFSPPSDAVRAAVEYFKSLNSITVLAVTAVSAAIAVVGAFFGMRAMSPQFRARHHVERSATLLMIASSVIAILTTIGIVASLAYEAFRFFQIVPINEFLFGTRWEPQIALRADQIAGQGAFGALPVIFGTFVISLTAMLVSVPVGILAAIYLTEYASPRFRGWVKPMLEILAGIPTVVYGFFAVLTVAPAVRALGQAMGIEASPNSSLAAGMVMGVMIIPFISSLSDDAFAAVPRALREGSYALGATKGETIRKVLFPAALPGIVGGILLGLSKAIGETMIVSMAAGLIATYALNPFEAVTTVTVQIVTLLVGDSEFDNPKTLAAFALGLLLFLMTLALNLIALRTVRKYREQY
jgi:phosphate transport system permease protein